MNIDDKSVAGFGQEWSRFSYSNASDMGIDGIFKDYFSLFPFDKAGAYTCLDIGCGTGRWSMLAANRVGVIHLLDASPEALVVAQSNMAQCGIHNVKFISSPIHSFSADVKYDAAWSLGVLHHLPDTQAALNKVSTLLAPGAPFLVYLYYRFDNRPLWFRLLWWSTDLARRLISRTPFFIRHRICDLIGAFVYWPLSRFASLLAACRIPVGWIPLAYYRDKSFYVMRTDALDRFGTRLENRFTKSEIHHMLTTAGFERIQFSDREPYWTALCYRGPS